MKANNLLIITILIIILKPLNPSLAKKRYEKIRKIDGITFVFVKGGSFYMGSPENRGYFNERPAHKVTVGSFLISKYEITQRDYIKIMGSNPSEFKGARRPVENVSWYDAMEFCRRFGKKNALFVRLPYEAEWEYAARAGSTTLYYWGDKVKGQYCWYNVNSGDTTHPVGLKKPNRWGLYDMSGNVYEWCMDYYSDTYYSKSPSKNPTGPETGLSRVVRGGSWHNNDFNIRSGFRVPFKPERKYYYHGFRPIIPVNVKSDK